MADARLRGRLVLGLDGRPDLVSVDRDLGGRLDAEPHRRADDFEHRDGDVVAETDPLSRLSRDYEHPFAPPSRLRPPRVRRTKPAAPRSAPPRKRGGAEQST